jgi:hypothetical protein
MKFTRKIAYVMLGTAIWMASTSARGQVVINEIVEDEQDFDSTVDIDPDTREFVELYNAGASPVNIGDWTLGTIQLTTGLPYATFTIPTGATIPAGGYYVVGNTGVPNVNFTPDTGGAELYPNLNAIFELRNSSTVLVDAVGLETFRGTELATATQEQVDQIAAGQTAGPAATGGWWGQHESNNALTPNVPLSIGRYLNGRDTNRNGYDFGMQVLTPGASNNVPQNASHTVPNVDSLSVGTLLGTNYASSFVLPQVIDPTVVGATNPNAITASPQGGKAIVSFDTTGGGNASYSKELVKKFDIWAFIDPRPLNVTTSDTAPQSEASIYGIGTTDTFFGTPNSADLLTGNIGGNITSSSNGSTGLGWLIQRRELFNGGAANRTTKTVLQLLDMNDGGDGVIADADWTPIQTIDLTGLAQGWHRLSIEYDPTTGNVIAKYDSNTYNFTTATNLVGNFYVGWRETLPGANNAAGRPPTYDLVVAAPPGVAGDYNGNGVVDAADYVLWRNGGPLQNEVDAPGTVNAADYTAWRARFGNTSGSGSLGGGVVPEPTSLALVAIGLVAVCGRRRAAGC